MTWQGEPTLRSILGTALCSPGTSLFEFTEIHLVDGRPLLRAHRCRRQCPDRGGAAVAYRPQIAPGVSAGRRWNRSAPAFCLDDQVLLRCRAVIVIEAHGSVAPKLRK